MRQGGQDELANVKLELGLAKQRIEQQDKVIEQLNERLDKQETKFVSVEQYKPVQSIVYGMVATALMAVLWTVLNLVGLKK